MTAPWNIRVKPLRISWRSRQAFSRPDAYKAEVRLKGKWYEAGVGDTWWAAFRMGLVA
jgi:hypothetical protein